MTEKSAVEKIKDFEKFGSKLGLERMSALAERLGNPQEGMKIIHVAGTNGKGSVCRYIYSVLRENGYSAGLYTSPFVEDFCERFEADGRRISAGELAECTDRVMEKVKQMLDEGWESPTEFEVLTAIAFLYFAKKNVEFVVLEVGLGGRGDSTNIVRDPLVTVITSISTDHTEQLGESLPEIAREKAGIIKEGRPVIIHVGDASAAKAIAGVAYEKNAPLIDAGRMPVSGLQKSAEGYCFSVRISGKSYSDIRVTMPGMHQVRNAVCALCAIDLLRSMKAIRTDGDALRRGMEKARQTGRFEIIPGTPVFILDGAHNESGAAALAETAADLFPGRKTLFVTGVLKDKNPEAMLAQFNRVADEYIATEPGSARRLPAEMLCEKIHGTGKLCTALPEPLQALEAAWQRRHEFDVIIISGSLYLLGVIRRDLYEKTGQSSAVL
ncbi:MAG: bifunctional folylpolyglutamate synthase/dihydrofolate synthase [Clostridiales Family XIII bacterium]|jgi:dihydrofolate synthase/folylpolyglutamate synthase|nr:bifunctional folylpolyglutamate synthase/dihydrofolate synthase [Clostridiales Family XIII bacterium]